MDAGKKETGPFDKFSCKLVGYLQEMIPKKYKSKREYLWIEFHQLRTKKQSKVSLWAELLQSVSVTVSFRTVIICGGV